MQRAATAFCVHFVPELLGSTKRKKDKFRHEPHDIKHVFHLFVLSAFSRVVRKLISMDAPKQEPNKIESHSLSCKWQDSFSCSISFVEYFASKWAFREFDARRKHTL